MLTFITEYSTKASTPSKFQGSYDVGPIHQTFNNIVTIATENGDHDRMRIAPTLDLPHYQAW